MKSTGKAADFLRKAVGALRGKAAVLRARLGGTTTRTSSVAVVLPPVPETPADDAADAPADTIVTATDGQEATVDSAEDRTPGWWSRLMARVLRLVGRR